MNLPQRNRLTVRHLLFGIAPAMAILLTVAVSARADDWPQYRGPNSTGISTSSKPLPETFSDTENVAWSAELGDGIGSAIVVDGRVFVSGMSEDKKTVNLYAFDAESGEKLWQRDWDAGELHEIHETNSHASTTPAADSERVYFYFSTLGMQALDAKTGDDVWKFDMPIPYFVFKWGPGMSPVLHKDLVLFVQDDDLYPALYAIDKKTGELRWKDDRLDMAVNYSHPVICTVDGVDEIVVGGTGKLIGYDPKDGRRKWYAKTLLRNIKTTPVVRDGVIFVSLQSGGIAYQWLASVDAVETGKSDGKVSKEEIQAFMGKTPIPDAFYEKTFGRGDLNKDGLLEGEELDIAFLHPDNRAGASFTKQGDAAADEFVMAVKGGGEGDVTETHVLWKHRTKHTDHVVSPYVHDNRILLVKGGGIATVFETEQGEPLGGPRRIENTSDYFASPVYGDGKIYVAGANGIVVVMNDSPEYEPLAANDMADGIVATPAIANGKLFIRTRMKLYAIGK
ncbi:MAG: PQQ-binding-like beta-propeller repeat protein [Planctomycetota bacterium]|nr:PQQ-binding-like beta-propeller repeat protein [Planctomycetota bacterium]